MSLTSPGPNKPSKMLSKPVKDRQDVTLMPADTVPIETTNGSNQKYSRVEQNNRFFKEEM